MKLIVIGCDQVCAVYPNIESTAELATSWIDYCAQNHPRCPGVKSDDAIKEWKAKGYMDRIVSEQSQQRDTAIKSFLPTRLLDLNPSDQECSLRLCLRQDVQSSSTYIALSHCWGANPEHTPTTTSNNLRERLKEIPMDCLPPTFRDAVLLTRQLRCRYLWIDSFCIIQDSTEDWEQESFTMADVYGHAYCTIAASSAVDCNGGLFVPRNPLKVLPAILTWPSPSGVSEGLVVHPVTGDEELHVWEKTLNAEPLNCRGWTLQERDLSPRILHFTSRQLIWECRSQVAYEIRPITAYTRSLIRPRWGRSRLFDDFWNDFEGTKGDLTLWYSLIRMYSRRELKYPHKDKLAAVSGLARAILRSYCWMTDEYLAGIWRSDLTYGLCWFAECTGRLKRISTMNFPSWSWAAYNGDVRWPAPDANENQTEDNMPKILEACTTPLSCDQTGQILSGAIKISGYAEWLVNFYHDRAAPEAVFVPSLSTEWDIYNEVVDEVYGTIIPDCVDVDLTLSTAEILILKMMGPGGEFQGVTCLALIRVAEGEDTYRRIGIARIIATWDDWFSCSPAKVITLV